jgi:hypothetical protein
MRHIQKIISGLAISITIFSTAEGMETTNHPEEIRTGPKLAAQIQAKVQEILKNFMDRMNKYYERTGNPKRIISEEPEPSRVPPPIVVFHEGYISPEGLPEDIASAFLAGESTDKRGHNTYYDYNSNFLGTAGSGDFITPSTALGINLPQPDTRYGVKLSETDPLKISKLQSYLDHPEALTEITAPSADEGTDIPLSGTDPFQIIKDPDYPGRIVISTTETKESDRIMASFIDLGSFADAKKMNVSATQGVHTRISAFPLHNVSNGGLGNPEGNDNTPPSDITDESKQPQGYNNKSPRSGWGGPLAEQVISSKASSN